jgi:N-acyl-D-aspartate/D-glutamate deacylase
LPPSRSERKPARIAAALAALGALLAAAPLPAQATYDIIIRNGRVLDGTGNPWYRADVGVRGDRIAAVGDLAGARAARVIDATGLYVAPGFIDVHTHAGDGLATAALSHGRPLLAQGITTVLVNPDGGGATDMARQRAALQAAGIGVNVAQMVPHGSVRQRVMGMADRAPTPAEMEQMRALVRTAMEEGAFGISTGPWYAPGSFAKTEELIDLSKVVAGYGGAYSSHIRDEADYSVGLVAAVDEVIRIGREARLRVVATHLKALGPRVWGYSAALVSRIDRARAEGVEVFADQYPYTASATSLSGALVPRWALAGGDSALRRRIGDPAEGARLRAELLESLDRRGGAERIQFRRHRPDPRRSRGRRSSGSPRATGWRRWTRCSRSAARGRRRRILQHARRGRGAADAQPWVMTASDGDLVPMGEGVPHPRSYGTFPRKIREYVVRRGVVDLAGAIRGMTSLPATVFRIPDRGILRAGAIADVVVFDLARIDDPATFADPHRLGEGMAHVLVNGQPALTGGSFSATLHGRVLARDARPEGEGRRR